MAKKILILTFILFTSHLLGELTPLERLMQGNDRYAKDQLKYPNRTSDRREATIEKQKPFATILACSDSRVPPEIIFDQGIGDLFIVRVAGNVLGDTELDSIEYASLVLGSSLIFVMGHENCGAVKATMSGNAQDIESVGELISEAIKSLPNGASLDEGIKANVKFVTSQLKTKPIIKKLLDEKKVAVHGGFYQLGTGRVEILD